MKELKPINITSTPEVLRLAQEVARTRVPVMLKTDDEDLAVLAPASKPQRRSGRPKAVTQEDPPPIWSYRYWQEQNRGRRLGQ